MCHVKLVGLLLLQLPYNHGNGWINPWSQLHLDYAGPLENKMFLVVIDAHSKWLGVFPVSSATSEVGTRRFRQQNFWHNGWVKAKSKMLA